VVVLSAGSLIPADGDLLEAKDFFVNQAVLTAKPSWLRKKPGTVPANASLAERTNCAFTGTSAASGTAHILVVQNGRDNRIRPGGGASETAPPRLSSNRGIRHFGNLLTQVMLVMVVVVLGVNIF